MIHKKNAQQIEWMRESNLWVGKAIAEMAGLLRPGVTTLRLDKLAGEFIRDNGGIPSFLNYHGFPYNTCISVNDAVVHGFPGTNELREGDIISMDCGVYKNGYHGDSAYTFAIGEVSEEIMRLLSVTKHALYLGIEQAVPNSRVGDIAYAIQQFTEGRHGFGVVRELVGHGIGRNLHEDPQVPNYGHKGNGAKLPAGAVIAIEPMINLGKKDVFYDADGWTVRTKDGTVSAHFEHSVHIKKGKPDILSSFESIEAAEQKNEWLTPVAPCLQTAN